MSKLSPLTRIKLAWQFDIEEQLEFIEYFESFSNTGMKTTACLQNVWESYAEINGKSHIACQICEKMIQAVTDGVPYEDVVKQYFHPNIAIGYELAQKTSSDNNVVEELINLVKLEKELKAAMLGKLFVPLIILVLGIAMQVLTDKMFMPIFLNGKEPMDSFEVRLSHTFGLIFVDYIYITATAFVALIAIYKTSQDRWVGSGREVADRIWPYSLYRVFWGIRLLKFVGLLKRNGEKEVNAYLMLSKYAPPYIQEKLQTMIEGARTGAEKRTYFGHGLLENNQYRRLSVYMKQTDQRFTEGLLSVSNRAMIDVQTQTKKILWKWGLGLMAVGFALLAFSMGAMFDSAFLT